MVDDPSAVADPLPIPPLSPSMFSDDLTLPDDFFQFNNDDYDNNAFFDDIFTSDFNSSNPLDPQFTDLISDPDGNLSGNHHVPDVSQFLNVTSSDEIVTNSDNSMPESRNENTVSSQGSGNCDGSEGVANMNCASPDSDNSVVDQKVKRESGNNSFMLKRKNDSCDVNSDSRTNKYRKSNETSVITSTEESNPVDEKKKARLIRNRESAQLSRQRKKHYVEELEDKVRAMHSTIQDLNARITYFAAENATLKQQMVVNNGNININANAAAAVCAPNVMYPPHPGMPPMGYPWMPCPPYVVKSQGSQVPLVPIPRLKPQQTVSVSSQKSKKADVKKNDITSSAKSKTKTKKVASISFLGLLLFILMFGGLVPIMNTKFGGVTNGGYGYSNDYNKFFKQQHSGRVLMGDDHVNGTNHRKVHELNASEPLVASLYVPRNDKLVKIDGNLIIHSVLASEKAMASREEEKEVTKKEDSGLGVALDLAPAIPEAGRNGGRSPHMYRTSSNGQRVLSSDKENLKSKHVDGKLQQWFREGLAGPMLSSGMCTEVFQFDVSAAIVPATSVANLTGENRHNSTYLATMKNRRILHGLPIPLLNSTTNMTKEQMGASNDTKHENLHKNSSVSSMVVSVLFDPREAGDGADMEGMMGGKSKSFSRIFVVVLLDSVKYVTYSCMLPLKGASHLVAV